MPVRSELGTFLQSRRARLQPEELGLVAFGERRRVPGLRREELAQLAGVSASYYTRLEQGQAQNASDEVLDSIARALRLDVDERAHLRRLARPARSVRRPHGRRETARPGLDRLLDTADDVPAWILGRWGDVLAWNRLGHIMLAPHLEFEDPCTVDRRPSIPRLLFLDDAMRRLYVDWEAKSRSCVAFLRLTAGLFPDDPALPALVGELSVRSPQFATLWGAHPVRHCDFVDYEFDHPMVGRLLLSQEVLKTQADPDQLVVMLTAQAGSPSEERLRLLASLAATPGRVGLSTSQQVAEQA